MTKPSHTKGSIKVSEPINTMGQIEDVDGVKWEVISVWPEGEYVTAAKTSEVSDAYSRWNPYSVQIVESDIK